MDLDKPPAYVSEEWCNALRLLHHPCKHADTLGGIGWRRAATVAVARAATVAVAVAVAVAVGVPVDGDTSPAPKSDKEASAV